MEDGAGEQALDGVSARAGAVDGASAGDAEWAGAEAEAGVVVWPGAEAEAEAGVAGA